jgi:ATP-binding cassette subfamily B protein
MQTINRPAAVAAVRKPSHRLVAGSCYAASFGFTYVSVVVSRVVAPKPAKKARLVMVSGPPAKPLPKGVTAAGTLVPAAAAAAATALIAGPFFGATTLTASLAIGTGALAATAVIVRDSLRRAGWMSRIDAGTGQPAVMRHPVQRLMRYAGGSRRKVILATAFSVVAKVLNITPPLVIGLTLTILIRGGVGPLAAIGIVTVGGQLIFVACLAGLIWTAESLAQYVSSILWRRIAQDIQHELRLDAYAHVQRMEMARFDAGRTGDLAAILNDDVNQLAAFLNSGANELVHVVTNLVVVGPMFFLLAPSVAWAAVLPIPIIIWASFFYEEYTAPAYRAVRDKAGKVNSQIVTNLDGLATITSFTSEDFEVRRIRGLSDDYRASNERPDELSSMFTPAIRMAVLLGFGGTILAGGYEVILGIMGAGRLASMLALTQRFIWPLTTLGQTVDHYQRTAASIDRVLGLLDTEIETNDGTRPLDPKRVAGEVVMDRVTFGYDGHPPLFRDFRLTMRARRTTAFVGATGTGKTTIVKLLLRLHEIDGGSIRIDGVDIREYRRRDLRRAIGLMSQDVFLFDGTIRENIAYGTFDATQEEIQRAAELAEAHDFIAALPRGYDTQIGERGMKLSGGQRQRICLARVFLKNAPILILDEATASVDNETEAAIQRALKRVAQDRTTIVIAHRLSTIRHADDIYVLAEGGRIVEHGSHDALLALNGAYAGLWRVQTGEAAVDDAEWQDELARTANEG